MLSRQTLFALLLFLACSVFYARPSLDLILHPQLNQSVGNGGDPITLPFQYEILRQEFEKQPGSVFSAGVYTARMNAPEGFMLYFGMLERFTALLATYFLPVESVHPALILGIFFLNALCFFAMARGFGWNYPTSILLALCFAFNPFTRSRASVHPMMAAVYHLPLILLAMQNIGKKRFWQAGICFFVASLTLQYHLVIVLALSPIFLGLGLFLAGRAHWPKLFLCMLPVLFVLALGFVKKRQDPENYNDVNVANRMLYVFSAHPIDYFSGDIRHGAADLNPLKQKLNQFVTENLENSNLHERSSGQRWGIWLLFLCGIFAFLKRRFQPDERKLFVWGFLLFAGAFLFSLPPNLGPVGFLQLLLPVFRVPSRFSILSHFAQLLCVGVFLHSLWKIERVRKYYFIGIFVVFEFFPLAPLLTNNLGQPIFSNPMEASTGIYLPYVSGGNSLLEYYSFSSRLRRSHAAMMNRPTFSEVNSKMIELFGEENFSNLEKKEKISHLLERLKKLTQCAQPDWIYFADSLSAMQSQNLCAGLKGRIEGTSLCRLNRIGPVNALSTCISAF